MALADPIEALDPLLARGRAERLAARQVHEPLVSRESGPFGQAKRRSGLAQSIKGTDGNTIWTARLRRGVRFQDGEPLDADAVLANAERWMSVEPGPSLLPDLAAVDSPRPGRVRFLLERSNRRFPGELGSARLGLVSPAALADAGAAPVRPGPTGTGPFEFREGAGARVLLARNSAWWGTPLGLGPGFDQIELFNVANARRRARTLLDGSADVAGALPGAWARRITQDPLLTYIGGRGRAMGMTRAVRGIESAEADQSLADAWLTDLR